MEFVTILEKDKFNTILENINYPKSLDWNFLYDIYESTSESAKQVFDQSVFSRMTPLNPIALILYICNEYAYYINVNNITDIERLNKSEEYQSSLASISLDKYFTNEHFSYKSKSVGNKYSPQISTISLYLNFILGALKKFKHNNPEETLVVDMLDKGFSMGKCIVDLLTNGFETEAFSTWRTLHETECILTVIMKYGAPVVQKYLVHMNYALAFRGGLNDKEKTDAVFEQIKEEMRVLDLKSKDMKRYIEYGWLLGVEGVSKLEGFKFNFRDGVERVAGLTQYSKTYEMSSEIAHSSPLLIYSKKDSFYMITLLNLYESFFRLEAFFLKGYVNSVSEDEKTRFEMMRKVYYTELIQIHKSEQQRFVAMNTKKVVK